MQVDRINTCVALTFTFSAGRVGTGVPVQVNGMTSWKKMMMMMMMIIIIIIIIIIKALKGAIRDFLQSPHCAANYFKQVRSRGPVCNRVQITCNTSSAYHVQHVVLRAMWYEETARLLSLTELKSHLFQLYFIGYTINR